jgi:hypothetical protein
VTSVLVGAIVVLPTVFASKLDSARVYSLCCLQSGRVQWSLEAPMQYSTLGRVVALSASSGGRACLGGIRTAVGLYSSGILRVADAHDGKLEPQGHTPRAASTCKFVRSPSLNRIRSSLPVLEFPRLNSVEEQRRWWLGSLLRHGLYQWRGRYRVRNRHGFRVCLG